MSIIEREAVQPPQYALGHTGIVATSVPSLRETLESVFKDRRRIAKAMAVTFGVFLLFALVMPSRYAAHASLLVNFGPEYTVRPQAGQETIVNQVAERDQILATESEILHSRVLHEAVIRKVGLERLYPDYLHPSFIGVATQGIRRGLAGALRAFQGLFTQVPPKAAESEDPVSVAAEEDFAHSLNVEALKMGNVIELTFQHKDPELAAFTLNTLISEYLAYRQRLYADVQAPKVVARLAEVKRQLDDADGRLRAFKADNSISNFTTQMDVLLHREGELATDQQAADSTVKQLTRRLANIRGQLATTPEQVTQYSDLDIETLQESLDQMRAREVDMREHYLPDSAPLVEIRKQIAAGEAEVDKLRESRTPLTVRTGRNGTYEAVDLDRARSEADLNTAQARLQSDVQQLASLREQVSKLTADETQLDQLERERSVADDEYRALAKIYSDRKLVEDVNARQVTTVRAVQQVEVPIKSLGRRRLWVLAGIFVSLLVGTMFAVVLDYTRRSYLSPQALERSLGVPVLANIPESGSLLVPVRGDAAV